MKNDPTECQICSGEPEPNGTCANFLCPNYTAPNITNLQQHETMTPQVIIDHIRSNTRKSHSNRFRLPTDHSDSQRRRYVNISVMTAGVVGFVAIIAYLIKP